MIRIYQDPAPVFHVVSYGDSAINVRVRLYADYDDLFQLGWDLNRRLKLHLTQPRLKSLSLSGWFIMSIKLINRPSQLYHHAT